MNYIKMLQEQVKELKQDKKLAFEGVQELMEYLTSPKFHFDSTVQVGDVLARLWDVRKNLF